METHLFRSRLLKTLDLATHENGLLPVLESPVLESPLLQSPVPFAYAHQTHEHQREHTRP